MSSIVMERYARNPAVPSRTAIAKVEETVTLQNNTQSIDPFQLSSNRGDIWGFMIEFTDAKLTTGSSLAGALTAADLIKKITIRDPRGGDILSEVPGKYLPMLARKRGQGVLNTPPTLTTSNQSYQIVLPWPIKRADLPAEVQITIEDYAELDANASGGSFKLKLTTFHQRDLPASRTVRCGVVNSTTVNGDGQFDSSLFKGVLVEDLYMVTTEANITHITFTRDGAAEVEKMTPAEIGALDDHFQPGQHVSNELELYAMPFVRNDDTRLQITATAAQAIAFVQVFTRPEA